MPSAGLCTTVVCASWGEVGDTLPCREGMVWVGRMGEHRGRCRGIPTYSVATNIHDRLMCIHQNKDLELQYRGCGAFLVIRRYDRRCHGAQCQSLHQHCGLQDHFRISKMRENSHEHSGQLNTHSGPWLRRKGVRVTWMFLCTSVEKAGELESSVKSNLLIYYRITGNANK